MNFAKFVSTRQGIRPKWRGHFTTSYPFTTRKRFRYKIPIHDDDVLSLQASRKQGSAIMWLQGHCHDSKNRKRNGDSPRSRWLQIWQDMFHLFADYGLKTLVHDFRILTFKIYCSTIFLLLIPNNRNIDKVCFTVLDNNCPKRESQLTRILELVFTNGLWAGIRGRIPN